MPALEVRSLGRRFGRRQAVDDVSFRVERGQVFGLLGPNGSGKTTTLACALGLLSPTSGETSVLGVPSRHIQRTRGRVGVVFDGANLLDALDVQQNLVYAQRLLGHAGGRTVAEALELTGLTDFARRRVARLSLGERKRVAVARALLGSPELIVLDEPLSALDTLGVASMLELIRELAGNGTTLVVSSHRLHEMERVISHAAILSRGRLVACGPLGELLGGDGEPYRLAVEPLGRARAVCAQFPGAHLREPDPGSTALDHELCVHLEKDPVSALNRALVEAGCEVSMIRRERSDLAGLFASLMGDEDEDGS